MLRINGVTFTPIKDRDLDFLENVYRSTREEEIARVPWSEKQKSDFIHQQFLAQHHFYREQFREAEFDIIRIEGKPAGRLYLEERSEEYRIIDIALLPAFRGFGWGTQILEAIKEMADIADKGVGIHVEKNNPAMNLYSRLGFMPVEDKGVYQFMMWNSGELKDNEQ